MTEPNSTPPSVWQTEPFRLFFPLGVLIGWAGLSQWVLFPLHLIPAYSCELHGFIQMQAFTMAFALGFLLTALPRRTQSPPPTHGELAACLSLLVTITAAGVVGGAVARQVMMAGYVALLVILSRFALTRFVGAKARRRPPAAFVLVPIAAIQGLLGPAFVLAGPHVKGASWMYVLGRLFIEQGVFLCLIVGVGALLLPLVGGWPPPADLGSSPRETRRAGLYAGVGLVIVASQVAESLGWMRAGPIVRGAVVALGLLVGGGAWKAPRKAGFHRRLLWLSVWLTAFGVALSGMAPTLRVASLHVLFIGGYSLMVLAVATHVTYAHVAGLDALMLTSHRAIVWMGVLVVLAVFSRVAADLSHTYYEHLGSAALLWMLGSGIWLAFLGPKLLRRTANGG